jgi:gas vesicle protein
MENNNNKSNNFVSGFLIGALVGAAIVFFLGTEKGKKLLKMIADEGMEKVKDVMEKTDKAELEEVYEEEPEFNKEIPSRETHFKKVSVSREEKPKTKRFFRGISRHLN